MTKGKDGQVGVRKGIELPLAGFFYLGVGGCGELCCELIEGIGLPVRRDRG